MTKKLKFGIAFWRAFLRNIWGFFFSVGDDIPPLSRWDAARVTCSEEPSCAPGTDLRITLPSGTNYEMIVDYILRCAQEQPDYDSIYLFLTQHFGLGERDAHHAIDRTLGGVTRAASISPELYPDQLLDPIAWHSFQRTRADMAIMDAIYPRAAKEYRHSNDNTRNA